MCRLPLGFVQGHRQTHKCIVYYVYNLNTNIYISIFSFHILYVRHISYTPYTQVIYASYLTIISYSYNLTILLGDSSSRAIIIKKHPLSVHKNKKIKTCAKLHLLKCTICLWTLSYIRMYSNRSSKSSLSLSLHWFLLHEHIIKHEANIYSK